MMRTRSDSLAAPAVERERNLSKYSTLRFTSILGLPGGNPAWKLWSLFERAATGSGNGAAEGSALTRLTKCEITHPYHLCLCL